MTPPPSKDTLQRLVRAVTQIHNALCESTGLPLPVLSVLTMIETSDSAPSSLSEDLKATWTSLAVAIRDSWAPAWKVLKEHLEETSAQGASGEAPTALLGTPPTTQAPPQAPVSQPEEEKKAQERLSPQDLHLLQFIAQADAILSSHVALDVQRTLLSRLGIVTGDRPDIQVTTAVQNDREAIAELVHQILWPLMRHAGILSIGVRPWVWGDGELRPLDLEDPAACRDWYMTYLAHIGAAMPSPETPLSGDADAG